MAAAKKLLIDSLVARPAVGRRYHRVDDKAMMISGLLSLRDLVAVETIDALARVSAHFEFMHD